MMKNVRSYFTLFTSILVSSTLLTGCGSDTPPPEPEGKIDLSQSTDLFTPVEAPRESKPQPSPESVIATVNGKEIKQAHLNDEITMVMQRAAQRVPPERLAQLEPILKEQALEALISKHLLLHEIGAQEVDVTEEEIGEAVDKIRESLPEGITLDQLAAQSETDVETMKEDIALDLKVHKLVVASEGERAEPTTTEIEAFYQSNIERFNVPESITARHLLITVAETMSDEEKAEKKEQIEGLRKQLIEGADFQKLSSTYSEGPSKASAGSLGKVVRGQTVPAFEEAAFSQEIGAIGEIVETQFGYHIILIEDKEEARTIPLEEATTTVSSFLASQSRNDSIQKYIKSLRDAADVNIVN